MVVLLLAWLMFFFDHARGYDACMIDNCDSSDGCIQEVMDCDDQDTCTMDYCDADHGCIHEDPEKCYPVLKDTVNLVRESHPAALDTVNSLRELQEAVEHIKKSINIIMATLYPAPTQFPTSIPTTIPTQIPTVVPTADPTSIPTVIPTPGPTSIPTLNPTSFPTPSPTQDPTHAPVQCTVSQDMTRSGFVSEESGCCYLRARHCTEKTICGGVLEEENCHIPNDVLYDPEKCWENAGYTVPRDDMDNPLDEEESFEIWMELAQCVQRACECTSEDGKWSVDEGVLSISIRPTHFSCCLVCYETNGCKKWHFLDQICVLMPISVMPYDVVSTEDWIRGEIPGVGF